MTQLAAVLASAAALCAGVALLVRSVRQVTQPVRDAAQVLDGAAWFFRRDPTTRRSVAETLVENTRQLVPNGGESMYDQVKSLRQTVVSHLKDSEDRTERSTADRAEIKAAIGTVHRRLDEHIAATNGRVRETSREPYRDDRPDPGGTT